MIPLRTAFSVILIAATAISSHADLVPIINGDFESPEVDPFTQGSIEGWTKVSGDANNRVGIAELSSSSINPPAIDGDQVAFLREGPYVMGQTLSITITENTVYTLSIYVGMRSDINYSGYTFGLYANGVALVSEANPTFPSFGAWMNRTLSYTAMPGDANIGQTLEVRFGNTAAESSGVSQTVFDAISLDASAVPEPSTYAMMGLGAALLLGIQRLRRKNS